jgi:hypothetical protein
VPILPSPGVILLDAVIDPHPGPPEMPDQVIDDALARALHADACRDHALVAWMVMRIRRNIRTGS